MSYLTDKPVNSPMAKGSTNPIISRMIGRNGNALSNISSSFSILFSFLLFVFAFMLIYVAGSMPKLQFNLIIFISFNVKHLQLLPGMSNYVIMFIYVVDVTIFVKIVVILA